MKSPEQLAADIVRPESRDRFNNSAHDGAEANHHAMNLAITIGCYKLVSFVELNILRCRRLCPEVPILLSDDQSDASKDIRALAHKYDCDYTVSKKRMSHFSGDAQAILNALVYAKECDVEFALKISQRVIPVLPGFFVAMDRAFKDMAVQICLPGRISKAQISRPGCRFYSRFGILSDVIGLRTGAIDPDDFLSIYRERCEKGRHPADSFCETTVGWLLDKRFNGNRHRILEEWTNHRHGMPKLYLRKSQSTASDYAQIAALEGIKWDVSQIDCREWREIEGRNYRAKADQV